MTETTQTVLIAGEFTNSVGVPTPWTLTSAARIFIDATTTKVELVDPAEALNTAEPSVSSAVPSGAEAATSSIVTEALTTAIPSTSTSTSTNEPNHPPTGVSAAPSDHDTSNLSTGALAGIAVGCAVAGILIGLAAAWLLFRRRRRGQDDRTTVSLEEPRAFATVEKPSPVVTDDSTSLNHFLLDATPDREIEAELQALAHLIDQHVEKYYHLNPVADVSVLSNHLATLGFFFHGAEAVAATCARPESRYVGLRHVISQVIFKSLDVYSQSAISMLPAPLNIFLDSMPSRNTTGKLKPGNQPAAMSQWRRLSAFLLHPSPYSRTPLPISEAAVSQQALAVANSLNAFLHHFVGTSRGAQTDHLQAVILECTRLGYVILSQPQDWRYVFEKGDMLVVCPGLDKGGRRVVDPEVAM
ncbi:hypothetical protein FDECE_13981 [Fusarium decemcellulare]|nr:hypothetical protein FDECE_13981 [Fusarium decemcellulare]